jgi:hypothetical protein
MPGYNVDEHLIREQALQQACQQMGWSVELGRRVLKAFSDALREGHARREKEARLLAQAEKRKRAASRVHCRTGSRNKVDQGR